MCILQPSIRDSRCLPELCEGGNLPPATGALPTAAMVSRTALMLAKGNVNLCLYAKARVSPCTASPLHAAGCTHRASALLNFHQGKAEKSIKSSTI